LERICISEARAGGRDVLFRQPVGWRNRICAGGEPVREELIGAVASVDGEHRAVLLYEQAGIVVIIALSEAAGPKVGFDAVGGVESAQDGFAVAIMDVAEVKNAVVIKSARVVVPGPGTIGGESCKIRSKIGLCPGKEGRAEREEEPYPGSEHGWRISQKKLPGKTHVGG